MGSIFLWYVVIKQTIDTEKEIGLKVNFILWDLPFFFKLLLSAQFQDQPDPFSEEHGLIYRAFVHLFDRLKEKGKQSDCTYVIKASFLEIYNEKVGRTFLVFFFFFFLRSPLYTTPLLLKMVDCVIGIECKG